MNLKKQNRKELDALTERFIIVMKQIIAHHPPVIKNRVAFAKKIGTLPQTINRWENGAGHPTLENCISLCRNFPEFVSPDYLLMGKKIRFKKR